MAFALIFVGILLAVSSVKNTQSQLFGLIHDDFTGSGNFIYWTAVVLVIGAIGYIPGLQRVSKGFLALIVIALILSKGNPNLPQGGLFSQLKNALASTQNVAGSATTKGSTQI